MYTDISSLQLALVSLLIAGSGGALIMLLANWKKMWGWLKI